jgi:hypothetical protein
MSSPASVRPLANEIRKSWPAVASAFDIVQTALDSLRRDSSNSTAVDSAADTASLLTLPPDITIDSVALTYDPPNNNGGIKAKIVVTFSVPGGDNFDRLGVLVEVPPSSSGTPLDPTGGPLVDQGEFTGYSAATSGQTLTFFMNPPSRQENWRIYVVSGSQYGYNEFHPSTDPLPSPNYLLLVDPIPSGGSGTEWAPIVSAFTGSIEYAVDQVGGQIWRVKGTFTPPTDEKYRGVQIVGRLGANDTNIDFEPRGAGGFTSRWMPVPNVVQSWTFYAVSIGPNNRVNTIAGGTPSFAASVQNQAGLGGLMLNRVDVSTFDTSDFQVSGGGPGVFNMKIVNADKITTGTLKVGGGGSKPGQLGVFDASNNLIGWCGTNGGYYGGWFKQLWVGGTDPSTAPFYVDSGGNVVIDNTGLSVRATFTLVRNSSITKVANDTGFGETKGLSVKSSTSSFEAFISQYGLKFIGSGGNVSGYFQCDGTNASAINLMDNTSVVTIQLAGASGVVQGKQFNVGANTIVDTSRNADFVSLKIGSTTVIDSSRIADVVSLKIGGTERINSSGNVNAASTYSVAGTQVVAARGASIADVTVDPPTTGSVTADSFTGDAYNVVLDTRDKLNLVLARLRAHGLIA